MTADREAFHPSQIAAAFVAREAAARVDLEPLTDAALVAAARCVAGVVRDPSEIPSRPAVAALIDILVERFASPEVQALGSAHLDEARARAQRRHDRTLNRQRRHLS